MDTNVLASIEGRLAELSREEQLWLIERLAHRLRENGSSSQASLESELAAMAGDPDIQRELLTDELAE